MRKSAPAVVERWITRLVIAPRIPDAVTGQTGARIVLNAPGDEKDQRDDGDQNRSRHPLRPPRVPISEHRPRRMQVGP